MAAPKKNPADKMVRVNLTLRWQDLEALQRLASEAFLFNAATTIQAGPEKTRTLIGTRPSVSSAIRHLVDRERERRLERARKANEGRELSEEQLLEGDPVFSFIPFGPGGISVGQLGMGQLAEVVNVGESRVGERDGVATKKAAKKKKRPPRKR